MTDTQTKQPARERLNAWIKGSKYRKRDFAAMIEVHPTTLSRILGGDISKPSLPTAYQIQVRTGNKIKVADWFE